MLDYYRVDGNLLADSAALGLLASGPGDGDASRLLTEEFGDGGSFALLAGELVAGSDGGAAGLRIAVWTAASGWSSGLALSRLIRYSADSHAGVCAVTEDEARAMAPSPLLETNSSLLGWGQPYPLGESRCGASFSLATSILQTFPRSR